MGRHGKYAPAARLKLQHLQCPQSGSPPQVVSHTSHQAALAEPFSILRNSIGMEFVLIPAGEFIMGSNYYEPDERPVHKVVISKPFYLGKYEVTQAQC